MLCWLADLWEGEERGEEEEGGRKMATSSFLKPREPGSALSNPWPSARGRADGDLEGFY